MQPSKTCRCGRVYGPDEWPTLKLVGYVGQRVWSTCWTALELRNCRGCASTIGVDVRFYPDGDLASDTPSPVNSTDGSRPAVTPPAAGAADFSGGET